MAAGFTYEAPDQISYLGAVRLLLGKKGQTRLSTLLTNASCEINPSSTFSNRRWNAYWTEVTFRLPMDTYATTDLGEGEMKALREACNLAMPSDTGLDVMEVDVGPSLGTATGGPNLESTLAQDVALLDGSTADARLPADLVARGKAMAEVYLYLYTVENTLRLFIINVGQGAFGDDYFDKLVISTTTRKMVEGRKEQERKTSWLSIRGDSPLFYVDFDDLASILQANWELFKGYFPDQQWIVIKIKELSNCRNLVAHNSYVGDHERDVIRVNFRSIALQLRSSAASS